MALKYRIVYDNCPRYKQNRYAKKVKVYLSIILLCSAAVLFFVLPPGDTKIYHLFLPGDPIVTEQAFCQLSESLDRGVALSDALDAFCKSVIQIR